MSLSRNTSTSSSIQSIVTSDGRGKRMLVDPVENDRISKLPDDVLLKILREMPTEQAVRTSVLSKRWECVWKQLPCLVFNMRKTVKFDGTLMADRSNFIAQLITKVINNHNSNLESCRIQHFSYHCKDGMLETWVQSLTQVKHTKGLALLSVLAPRRRVSELDLSPNIFSHPSLTSLYLFGYNLESSHAFNNCHNLMILKLDKICVEVNVFNKVIASCPSLKVLILDITWCGKIGCLKILNKNLKVLHLACTYIDRIIVSTPLLDILSIRYDFVTRNRFILIAPRILQFYENYWDADENIFHFTYNISCDAQKATKNIGHEFVASRNTYFLREFISLAVNVDLMNVREVYMLKEVLNAWVGEMRKLEIFFKHNIVTKEEGESSIGGAQKKKSKDELFFLNSDFRVQAVWMYTFNGLNKEEFALASHLVTQGKVIKKLMIKTSSIPEHKMLETEMAVAKLMELSKGNKKLSIECF